MRAEDRPLIRWFYVCDEDTGGVVGEGPTLESAKTACRTALEEGYERLEIFRHGDEIALMTAFVCERTGQVAFRGRMGAMRVTVVPFSELGG